MLLESYTCGGGSITEWVVVSQCLHVRGPELPEGIRALAASLGQLGALKEFTIDHMSGLQEMPDLIGLTALDSLTIDGYIYISRISPAALWGAATFLSSLVQLGGLRQLILTNQDWLQELPHTFGRMIALEDLTLSECLELSTLPESMMHLSRLQTLMIVKCPIQDMPCIQALTAMHTLHLVVQDYERGCHTFMSLSRSLPCLQQLQDLRLGGYKLDVDNAFGSGWPGDEGINGNALTLLEGDVLAIGRSLKAWPLPLLRHFELDFDVEYEDDNQVENSLFSTCWRALGLPEAAADWTDAMILDFFSVQHHKVAAFASGMHTRLGAASDVLLLNDQMLIIIVNEVLGRSNFENSMSL